MLTKLEAVAEVYKGDVDPDDWVVTALDPSGDGGIFNAIFSGPDARQRAVEYAEAKFREFRLHEPDQRPYRSRRSDAVADAPSPNRGANLRLVK